MADKSIKCAQCGGLLTESTTTCPQCGSNQQQVALVVHDRVIGGLQEIPESDIEAMIRRKTETANVDYKEGFEWKKENRDKQCELVKDMMAMANIRDGGRIVFGVEDASYDLVGVTNAILESLDQTKIGQTLYGKSTPKVSFEVQKTKVDELHVVIIRVYEFDDVPIICTDTIRSLKNSNEVILRKGAVYIRTPDARTEEISSDQEMRELLGRAMLKKSDELLRVMERLLKGKAVLPSPEVINRYENEVKGANTWFQERLGKGVLTRPRWELTVYPTQYSEDRIRDLSRLEHLIRESEVRLRGRPFPYISNKAEQASMFNSGFQAFYDSADICEAFRLYKSGLFVWKRTFWEDQREARAESHRRVLSFMSAIYSVMECILFIKRLYESLHGITHIHMTLSLTGCKDRELATFDGDVTLSDCYVSQTDDISVSRDFKLEELRADPEDVALQITRHIFHVFNWKDVPEETIAFWQSKFLGRVRNAQSQ
jgi:hypothetical protein